MLLELGIGADSASLKLGPAGRCCCCAAAALQILVRMPLVLACCCFMPSMICGGMPQEAALAPAYLTSLASAFENVVNKLQASRADGLRLLAPWMALAFFCASSRSLTNSLKQGGSSGCRCGCCVQGEIGACAGGPA